MIKYRETKQKQLTTAWDWDSVRASMINSSNKLSIKNSIIEISKNGIA